MSCVLTKDHQKIVRRLHFFHLKLHLISLLLITFFLFHHSYSQFEENVLRETLQTVRSEYSSIRMRHQMLSMLRTRPLTVGQAMDIADTVIQQNKVPVEVVFAVMKQESEFTPEAVSVKGAKGLMQVMPVVWKSYSLPYFKNMTDPVQNVHVGTLFLADLFHKFGDWQAVFRAYYAGPENYNNQKYNWYANAVLKKIADFRREMEN